MLPNRPPAVMRPLGILKLVLQSVELETAEHFFCVLKCGPHWGRTLTMHGTKPAWQWEVCTLLFHGTEAIIINPVNTTLAPEPALISSCLLPSGHEGTTRFVMWLHLDIYTVIKTAFHVWRQTLRTLQVLQPALARSRMPVQVHLPLYDPDTLLLLSIFSDPGKGRIFNHGGPQLVGKLRVRLGTVAAGQQHECHLPMMAERKQGGGRKATANLGLKVAMLTLHQCCNQ